MGAELGVITVCAGLKGKYESAELGGRSVAVLLNLKPAEFKGVKSEGMMLVGDQQKPAKLQGLLSPGNAPPGTKVSMSVKCGDFAGVRVFLLVWLACVCCLACSC